MTVYTPSAPSKEAIRKVPDALPIPTECRYCGSSVEVTHHDQMYGRSYGNWPWAYQCVTCKASTGMHPFTNIPLGSLADANLRAYRKDCKAPFENLWRSGKMSRTHAYRELAKFLGISMENCHWGLFEIDRCIAAKSWAVKMIENSKAKKSNVT